MLIPAPLMMTPKEVLTAVDPLDPCSREHLEGIVRWTLCLGAGISMGSEKADGPKLIPAWEELTRRVVNQVFKTQYAPEEFRAVVAKRGWNLDGWIQAAANDVLRRGIGGKSAEQIDLKACRRSFYAIIQQNLYSDLLNHARKAEVEPELARTFRSPRGNTSKVIEKVCKFFEARYEDTSLMRLVRWLLDAEKADRMPFAVISFNVEPLFFRFSISSSSARTLPHPILIRNTGWNA